MIAHRKPSRVRFSTVLMPQTGSMLLLESAARLEEFRQEFKRANQLFLATRHMPGFHEFWAKQRDFWYSRYRKSLLVR